MKLKYIGAHGAMGLSFGQVYEVSIYTDDAIIVSVFNNHKCIATIPYSGPQTLAENWENPDVAVKEE